MPGLAFHKYEGLGNDFIVVEVADEDAVSRDRAIALCDRRFGVGADGVLLVMPPRSAAEDARLKIVNADGSVPEMCGNGVRCVALHLARARRRTEGQIRLETDAGLRECIVDDRDGQGAVVVDMGVVQILGDRQISLDGERVALTIADAGNPHAVTFVPEPRQAAERLGGRLATHSEFPRGTNVEFARVGDKEIELVVWERGVGLTLACGTGACATVAAACARGLVPYGVSVAVRLPGGILTVRVDPGGHATMRGPATLVFRGEAV